MNCVGNPYDNAKAESFMKTLKQKRLLTILIAAASSDMTTGQMASSLCRTSAVATDPSNEITETLQPLIADNGTFTT